MCKRPDVSYLRVVTVPSLSSLGPTTQISEARSFIWCLYKQEKCHFGRHLRKARKFICTDYLKSLFKDLNARPRKLHKIKYVNHRMKREKTQSHLILVLR